MDFYGDAGDLTARSQSILEMSSMGESTGVDKTKLSLTKRLKNKMERGATVLLALILVVAPQAMIMQSIESAREAARNPQTSVIFSQGDSINFTCSSAAGKKYNLDAIFRSDTEIDLKHLPYIFPLSTINGNKIDIELNKENLLFKDLDSDTNDIEFKSNECTFTEINLA